MRFIAFLFLSLFALGVFVASFSKQEPKAQAAVAKSSTAADAAMLSECRKKLDVIGRKTGVWNTYNSHDGYGTVEVRDSYYIQSFDGKKELNSVFYCVMTDGRMDKSLNSIDYLDFRTHKTVATWSKSFGLTVE